MSCMPTHVPYSREDKNAMKYMSAGEKIYYMGPTGPFKQIVEMAHAFHRLDLVKNVTRYYNYVVQEYHNVITIQSNLKLKLPLVQKKFLKATKTSALVTHAEDILFTEFESIDILIKETYKLVKESYDNLFYETVTNISKLEEQVLECKQRYERFETHLNNLLDVLK